MTHPTAKYSTRIHWYGERGIVNAIVSYITSPSLPQDEYLERVKAFLRAITWRHDKSKKPAWIEQVTHAEFLVEISLADFGNPDLMIVCTDDSQSFPYVVFVEAKVSPYEFSAGNNRAAMKAPGYNSTINGQIALKYQFAQALSQEKQNGELAEPQPLSDAYKAKLGETASHCRHLKKKQVLAILEGLGLMGLPETRCHYVALTWDDSADRVFKEGDDDIQPRFLNMDGNRFDQVQSRYGWLGYHEIETALGLTDYPEYHAALSGMLKSTIPTVGDYERYGQARKSNQLSPDIDVFMKAVIDLLLQESQRHIPRGCEIGFLKGGSYSLKCGGVTIAKVMRGMNEDTVFVGVRYDGTIGGYRIGRERFVDAKNIVGVPFRGTTFDSLEGIDITAEPKLVELAQAAARVCQIKATESSKSASPDKREVRATRGLSS